MIRSKILYGLESAQLNEPHVKRLNTFQLKGLRKILHLQTTYIDRDNTNAKVIADANARSGGTHISLFSEVYERSKIKLFAKLIIANNDNPVKSTTLNPELQAWEHANRRVGRPKMKWATEAANSLWEAMEGGATKLNLLDMTHRNRLVEMAQTYAYIQP